MQMYFRPIALCNFIYKIISKVVANRLKEVLPLLIGLEKFGFVVGQQILDGIIMVHEAIHSLKVTKNTRMLVKHGNAKAYDKLSWQYMREVLDAFGFSGGWIEWVMNLVSSTFFSILLNDSPSRTMNSSIDIR